MATESTLREEILEAALEALEEGVAVLDGESRVLSWNEAATTISGHLRSDVLGRKLPTSFYQIDTHHHASSEATPAMGHRSAHVLGQFGGPGSGASGAIDQPERPMLVNLHHARGHSLPAMLRRVPLRDALGKRFGTLLRFHTIDEVDTLPHGEMGEDSALDKHVEHSQADLEDRLDQAFQGWRTEGVPFGLLWITVDQAADLRKTHGRDAAEAMLGIVERTLVHALRPTEILGRWGSNEFLVLCHERTPEMLEAHAQRVGMLARTADFRWWGDRASLTLSVGAAQAEVNEKLGCLLKRAQKLMETSRYAGGNQVTMKEIPGSRGQECSQL